MYSSPKCGMHEMAHTADGLLIESVLNGCSDEFEKLMKRYDREIRRIVGAMVTNRQDRQDIVQDIWLSVYQRLSSLRDPERFPQWLRAIARNRCLAHVGDRKHRELAWTEVQPEEGAVSVWPGDEHLDRAKRRSVRKAVATLSHALGRTVAMYYFTGYSCDEVSSRMNVPVGTVKRRLSEARSKLRSMFRDWSHLPAEGGLDLRHLIVAAPICTSF